MPEPVNIYLYQKVKKEANRKFMAPTSAYKSGWIVREYKRRGGTYTGQRSKGLLKRWFDEKWVDVTQPQGVVARGCGRSRASTKGMYPVCRPSIRVTKGTPRTLKELSRLQILNAIKRKQKVKQLGRIKFLM